MSEFNYNFKGTSDSVFKVPNLPTRYRKTTCNNTHSTYNNEVILPNSESTYNTFKKVEERYEVLKKICPPEDVEKILLDTVDRLTEACYEKMAEQLVRPSHSQAFSVGGSSVYSVNIRPAATVASNYGTSLLNIPDQPPEQRRPRINSTTTSRNHYGLLSAPIQDRPTNFASCDQFSRINDVYEVEPATKTRTSCRTVRSKKTIVIPTNDRVEKACSLLKEDPSSGLSIPLRIEKQNPPPTQSKRPSKKLSSEIKELEVLPSEDESDSLSVFFGKGRNATSKPSTSQTKQNDNSQKVTKIHDVSVTLNRINFNNKNESKTGPSRKRKASQQHDDTSTRKKSPVVQKETGPSPDTTTPNNNITERKPSKLTNNEVVRKPKRNNSLAAARKQQESTGKVKENKENKEKSKASTVKSRSQKEIIKSQANTAPKANRDTELNTADKEEVFDDGSFFGDVSSIVGADSVLLSNTMGKNTTKHSTEGRNEMPSHFFSPFANIRSTSGVSAISTPLSKTVSKNVLGKRVKKPSVVAELKGIQRRKPRKAALKAADIARLAHNDSESSESDPEASDFSD